MSGLYFSSMDAEAMAGERLQTFLPIKWGNALLAHFRQDKNIH